MRDGQLCPALDGVEAVYVVDSQRPDAPEEVRELADLAAAGSVRSVLLSSRTYGEMGEHRLATERAVKESGTQWTILRPSWFAQNFTEFDLFACLLGDEASCGCPPVTAKRPSSTWRTSPTWQLRR